MVFARSIFLAAAGLVALTNAVPLEKRIAQVIADSTTQWVQACNAAGGAAQCGTVSQTAFATLLAGAGDCDQQNAADSMVDLAKTLKNDPKMISLAQVFAQQPRNSPNKLSVNYCQQQPKNAELNGLFQCQFQGVDPNTFTNNVKVGGPGTIPLGMSAPLSPAGSCKANPAGGIADGTQLVALTQNPGVSGSGAAAAAPAAAPAAASSAPAAAASSDPAAASSAPAAAASAPAAASFAAAAPAAGGFQLQNGKDAQALNAKFTSLTATSACNTGDQACVNNGFAQCVGGKFTSTQCAGGTQCFALPLVNKAGTSITCTTSADATSRIAATGATGGVSGSGAAAAASAPAAAASAPAAAASAPAAAASAPAAAASPAAAPAAGGFQLQNGKDAQALNAKFSSLTATSACNTGDQACINNGFAQCVGGKFTTTQCAGGTQCFALPLVNKAGTSITCSTSADATSRIAATGATGGLTGA